MIVTRSKTAKVVIMPLLLVVCDWTWPSFCG